MDIKVEHLTKVYGSQKAVDDLSFEVRTGEILGFLGPNGAGKTTTMKAITTFLRPTSGNISIGKYSVSEHPEQIRKLIGYLPENNPLYQEMNVVDYLAFTAELLEIPNNLIRERILHMVEICGLEGEKHKKIAELSKGYKQRVGLAQALIHNPDVLILDEPTSGLDPNQIVEIRELIRKIGKEKTVILSSHILAEVEATCDRIVIINKGKIMADGTAESLRKQSQGNEVLHVTIEDGEPELILQSLKSLETVADADKNMNHPGSYEVESKPEISSRRSIFKLCVEKNWTLTELTVNEAKLEDVFKILTSPEPKL